LWAQFAWKICKSEEKNKKHNPWQAGRAGSSGAFINNKLCPKFALNNILCSRTGRDTAIPLDGKRLPAFSLLYLFFISSRSSWQFGKA